VARGEWYPQENPLDPFRVDNVALPAFHRISRTALASSWMLWAISRISTLQFVLDSLFVPLGNSCAEPSEDLVKRDFGATPTAFFSGFPCYFP